MAVWTYTQWTARLNHEIKTATNDKGIGRLKQSLRAAESFLASSTMDSDVDEWINMLRVYEVAVEKVGEKHG